MKPGAELKSRIKNFALRIIRLYSALPQKMEAQIIGKQLLRSGTSVGLNTVKESERNPMKILSVRLKVACKSWKNLYIGWNYW